MKKVVVFCLLLIKVAFGGHGSEHVHFKIHVPEIIKHHIHTKTVFIHVYEPKHEEKPHKEHEESYVEDWNAYKLYQQKNGLEIQKEGGESYKKKFKSSPQVKYTENGEFVPIVNEEHSPDNSPELGYAPKFPDDISNNLVDERIPNQYYEPGPSSEENIDPGILRDMVEHRYYGPGYEIYENVKEEEPKNQHYKQSYEEGYHRGSHSETGHVLSQDRTKFYDKEHNEGDSSKNSYQDGSFEKHLNGGYLDNHLRRKGRQQRSNDPRQFGRRYFIARMILR